MSKTYHRGIVYKMYSLNPNDDNYYWGSTTQRLCHRKSGHHRDSKTKDFPVHQWIRQAGISTIRLEPVETYNNITRLDLCKLEDGKIRESKNDSNCINCRRANRSTREYYTDNRGTLLEKQKDYYRKHKDQRAEYDVKYRAKNMEAIRQQRKDYYQKNADHVRERVRLYKANNPERVKLRCSTRVVCPICKAESTQGHLKRHQKTARCKPHEITLPSASRQ